jgi:hypothetical protein
MKTNGILDYSWALMLWPYWILLGLSIIVNAVLLVIVIMQLFMMLIKDIPKSECKLIFSGSILTTFSLFTVVAAIGYFWF